MAPFHNFQTALIAFCATTALLCASCATGARQEEDKSSPKYQARIYQEIGTQAMMRGDYSQAISDLKKSAELEPDNAATHNNLGLAYFYMGQKPLAREEMQRALKIDAKFSDAYVNLGSLAADQGHYDEAKAYYRKALTNLEYSTRHRALTALAQLSLRENKIDEARQLIYQSIQANPEYCLSHFLLGTIYTRDGNNSAAAQEYKKSVKDTCAGNVEGHYQLGLAYLKSKQYAKAKSQFLLLVEQYPGTIQGQQAGDYLRKIP